MSDFEMGMMVGALAGVWSIVVFEKVACRLLKVRVVAVPVEGQPCAQVAQEDAFGVDDAVPKKGPAGKVECCVCDGTGVRPYFPGNGYKGPNTIPCGLCKGTGWMTPPPKKP